jgi:hypothetical protein
MPDKRNLPAPRSPFVLTRRELLRTSAAGGLGLVIGFQLPATARRRTRRRSPSRRMRFCESHRTTR